MKNKGGNMKIRDKIITVIMCILVLVFLLVFTKVAKYDDPKEVYEVYLNGQKMGLIADSDELYNLIDDEQKDIKSKYNVNKVYPPLGFEIMKYTTYDNNITDVSKIYDKIKDKEDFTIEGYKVTISDEEDPNKKIIVNVLDDEIFKNALKNVVTAFISEEDFNAYINNEQDEIVDTGQIIEHMYFKEKIK